jgi:cell wall-associated NlpC family hydrolase
VIAFALVLGLVLTGVLRGSVSGLTLGRPARAGVGRVTGVSANVGAIPGVRPGSAYPWAYSVSQSPTTAAIAAKPLASAAPQSLPPLGRLLQADLLVVSPTALPAGLAAKLGRLRGVVAAVPVAAGRIQVNGVFVNVLGVDPATFRPFAAQPTARSARLWQNIAAGGMAISYTMGRQDKLTLTKPVRVVGAQTRMLPVAGFGTVGIGGIDAVVSSSVARSLGLPVANAIVISAPRARLDALMRTVKHQAPASAAVAALVTQVIVNGAAVSAGAAGSAGAGSANGPGLTTTELVKFLAVAKSRVGMPYVWGGAGPTTFDCSGLVQWSLAQAGVVMPRVAADQARTGPLLPLSQLRPGDLIFYHTDPTAPDYISHVAIYIGNGLMLQAPEPGMDVQIVPADFGAGFAGAVRVYPRVAAAVAASLAG